MNYWVVAADGNKYGPADLNVLNEWAAQGRLTADTILEVVGTGERLHARDIPNLALPIPPSQPAPQPSVPTQNPSTPAAPSSHRPYDPHDPLSQPTPQHQPQPQANPYQQQVPGQVYNPYDNPYPRRSTVGGDDGSKELTAAYVWAGAGFLLSSCCLPMLCYIPAFINANHAIQKGNPGGQTAKTVVIVLLVLSLLGGGVTFLSILLPIMTAGF
ncbi:MAG: DUF4339 domain-containing protein [Fimbriimonadaceae bacterium]|nr:DUF4339 domain-containing protein [Fimbriimonadaceae bacterium]